MEFTNPQNNYTETASLPWLWALLFGPLYFAYKRCYGHAIISFVLATVSFGFTLIIYAFFAGHIVRNNYRSRGWVEGKQTAVQYANDNDLQASYTPENPDINHIAFTYSDIDNNTTNRDIYVKELYAANGHQYIKAHCNHSDENRTFRIDRIQGDITLISTGEIIKKQFLIDAAKDNNKTPNRPKLPTHITIPTLKNGRLFTVKDCTDYADILAYDLTPEECQQLTQKDIENIDPDELELEINTFLDILNDTTLKGMPYHSAGLGELLLTQQLNNLENETTTDKKLATTPEQKQLLKNGFLKEITRTQAVEIAILNKMTVDQLKPVAKALSVKTSQPKSALISAIKNAITPDTPLPPLVVPNQPQLNKYLNALKKQFRKEALQSAQHAPANYQKAIEHYLEHEAEL